MNALSGILAIVGFVPYIWTILNGQTVPSPASWAIWVSVDVLALIAMKKERVAIGQITGAIIGASIVVILAILFGKVSMGFIEWISIAIATTGVILWQKTGNAIQGIIWSQIALFAGAIPTIIGAYHDPSKEDPIAWLIWTASCVFALCAVKKWDLKNSLQPLNFMVMEVTMVVLVVVRPNLF